MWKAKIIGKNFTNGKLTVIVEFSDGKNSFSETFDTNQKQALDWIDSEVKRRLDHLGELPALHDSITEGVEITLASTKKEPEMSAEKAEYKHRLAFFAKWTNAISIKATTVENEAFVAAHKWLRDNFKDEYIDLF